MQLTEQIIIDAITNPRVIKLITSLIEKQQKKVKIKTPASLVVDRFVHLSNNANSGLFLTASQVLDKINTFEKIKFNSKHIGRALSKSDCMRTIKNGVKHYCIDKIEDKNTGKVIQKKKKPKRKKLKEWEKYNIKKRDWKEFSKSRKERVRVANKITKGKGAKQVVKTTANKVKLIDISDISDINNVNFKELSWKKESKLLTQHIKEIIDKNVIVSIVSNKGTLKTTGVILKALKAKYDVHEMTDVMHVGKAMDKTKAYKGLVGQKPAWKIITI